MIRTITLNTGFDEVFTVSGISFGGVEKVLDHSELPAGKGINAARTIRALGHAVVAYGLVGAEDRDLFRAALLAEGVTPVLVDVPGRARRNLTLLSLSDHRPAAHFRAHGFDLHGISVLPALTDLVAAQVEPGDIVTINGSAPRGAAPGAWSELAGAAVRARAGLVVDIYGQDLPSVVRNLGSGILACTPNVVEIDDLPGVAVAQGDGRCAAALRFMAEQGVRLPIVTRGAEGVLFADDGGIWAARCSVNAPRVSVGAGDAFAGALAVGVAGGLGAGRELVCFATAVATAHVAAIPPGRLREELPAFYERVTFERWRDL
jgi:fructose-1-phosphate kinase PfkB-like protein